jgi:DNA-binding Lrp family transcriptional regulator
MSFKYFDYSGQRRRASPKEIGAKLGVDERTVRLRTRRMEKDGFIQYYQTIPNLQLFDQPIASLCNFQSPSVRVKPKILESLRRADNVIDIADFLGDSFGVTVSASSDAQARATAERLAQQVGIDHFQILPPRHFPVPEKTVSKLDWQLMKTLRYDAQRPTNRIAKELGITYRMADYSIRRLFESRTVSVRAIINARDPKGLIFYSINLVVDEEEREHIAHELQRIFGRRLWWTVNHSGPAVIMFLFANSVGRAEDDLLEALSKPAVTSGSITIFKGWVEPERPSWIDRALDAKIHGKII